MSRCLYCGAELNSRTASFCRGHHRPYRRNLINQWNTSADGSDARQEAGRLLRRFPGWWDYDNNCPTNTNRSETRATERSEQVARPVRQHRITGAFRKFGIELETVSQSEAVLTNAVAMVKASGVRIQHTGYNHNDVDYWKVLTDASLSGGFCREVVSPAFDSEAGIQEVFTVTSTLNTMGVKVNNTCGYHVHLDASDLTAKQIARIVKFYQVYEEEIDKLHQGTRRGNARWCGSLTRFTIDENRINSVRDLTGILGTRYLKVNVEAYLRHGTIEFRQHGATLDPVKITNWIKLCTRIVEFAKSGNEINAQVSLFDALNLTEAERIYWTRRMEVLAA